MKFKLNFSLLGRSSILSFVSIPTPKKRTGGKSSRIPNTIYHILPFDYDNVDAEALELELKALIKEFELGNVHIFKMPDREDAFHAVCLDYFLLHEVKAITTSSSCDLAFALAPRFDKFRSWVLRDFEKGNREKPVYYKTITSPYDGNNKQSNAHALYLNALYGCDIKLSNPDENTMLIMESYLTANRTKKA